MYVFVCFFLHLLLFESIGSDGVLTSKGLQNSASDRPEDIQLVRYWLAARKEFDKQETLHICLDSGRVGGTSWQLGAVQGMSSRGSGYMVAWAPPQNADVLSGCMRPPRANLTWEFAVFVSPKKTT